MVYSGGKSDFFCPSHIARDYVTRPVMAEGPSLLLLDVLFHGYFLVSPPKSQSATFGNRSAASAERGHGCSIGTEGNRTWPAVHTIRPRLTLKTRKGRLCE